MANILFYIFIMIHEEKSIISLSIFIVFYRKHKIIKIFFFKIYIKIMKFFFNFKTKLFYLKRFSKLHNTAIIKI